MGQSGDLSVNPNRGQLNASFYNWQEVVQEIPVLPHSASLRLTFASSISASSRLPSSTSLPSAASSPASSTYQLPFTSSSRLPPSTSLQKPQLPSSSSDELPPPSLHDFLESAPLLTVLSAADQESIHDHCFEGYKTAAEHLETIVADLAFYHPDAKEFSHEMCRRIYRLMQVYVAIKHPGQQELMTKLLLARAMHAPSTATGSVGHNPLAIERALKEGSLREQMTLIYQANREFLPSIYADAALVTQINQVLEGDFQLNTSQLDRERELAPHFFSLQAHIQRFRLQGQMAKDFTGRESGERLWEIKDLSYREARTVLQDYISEADFEKLKQGDFETQKRFQKRVEWVRGKNLYYVDPRCSFAARCQQIGGLPMISGPSGTTDRFLHGTEYLGMEAYKTKGLLACIGWMVSAGDHSLHEVRIAAEEYGVPYQKTPQGFEAIYPQDPAFAVQLEEILATRHLHLPAYYLSAAYQTQVAHEKGFI